MRKIVAWLERRSRPWVIGAGLLALAVTGWVDFISGRTVRMGMFYVAVVSFVTWLDGRRSGIWLALLSGLVAVLSEWPHPITRYELGVGTWNALMQWSVLLLVAYCVSALRRSQDHLEQRVAQRTSALDREVTDRRRVEALAQTSRAKFAAYVDSAVDGIITIDDRGLIDSFNPAAERLFGYAAREAIGQNVSILLPAPCQAEHDRHLGDYLQTGRRKMIGTRRAVFGRRKDGKVFPMELAVGEARVGDRHLFTGTVHDLTRHRQLESEVLQISDQERQRIAQDLHDGLCQHLTATECASRVLADDLAEASLPQAAEARQIAAFVNRAISQAHDIARGLNPVELGGAGLGAALQDLSGMVTRLYQIACVVKADGVSALLSTTEATHLYRIAQEAVTNAAKHGRPSAIRLGLDASAGPIVLSIEDNGAGFPEESSESNGMGINTMTYRAGLIGARLEIRRRPAGGTIVTCSLPRSQGAEREPSIAARRDTP